MTVIINWKTIEKIKIVEGNCFTFLWQIQDTFLYNFWNKKRMYLSNYNNTDDARASSRSHFV